MGICCSSSERSRIMPEIEADIKNQFIVVYSKAGCPRCLKIKSKLHSIRAEPKIIEVNNFSMKVILKEITKQRYFPFVFIGGSFIETRMLEIEINKGNIQNLIKGRVSEALRTSDGCPST